MITIEDYIDATSAYVTEPIAGVGTVQHSSDGVEISSDGMFSYVLGYYHTMIHLSILQAWARFNESIHAQAERATEEYRSHRLRKREEEGSRLEAERRNTNQIASMYLMGVLFVGRQASHFRAFDGMNVAAIHLHQPI